MNRSIYDTGAGMLLLNATASTSQNLGSWAMANRQNFDALASVPSGYPAAVAIVPPMFPGGMSSYRKGKITIEGSAVGALGLNGVAAGSISIVGSAIGGLIAGGVANGTITINGSAVMFAAIGGVATGVISVGGTAAMSAIGHMVAAGEITVDGTAVPYGIGWMDATSDFGNELTPDKLARAVWNAVAGEVNLAGTMGEKLNDAGSATNPWTEVIESGYTASQILRLLARVAAAKTNVNNLGGGLATVTFRDLADTKDAIVADMTNSNRTDVVLDLD
jgi:hypothetical protein